MPAEGSRANPGSRELIDLLGPFWTAERASEALGVDQTTLPTMSDDGLLLGLTTPEGGVFYPVFQFERSGGEVHVKQSLLAVFRTLRSFDPWTVAVLMHTPAQEFDGATPLEAARRKPLTDDFEEFGRVVAREWSAGGWSH